MVTKETVTKLLGRSLTTAENQNFSLYLDIATAHLSGLLCMDITCQSGKRKYSVRGGYRTIFTAPFTGDATVYIDDVAQATNTYQQKQLDNWNGSWYNSIVFNNKLTSNIETIEVEADWGFNRLPSDLSLLLADLFADVSGNQSIDERVQSKQIEDFRVTYKDISNLQAIEQKHSNVIAKYSICNGAIRHGRVCTIR